MTIPSMYTKAFVSDSLTREKYEELLAHAMCVQGYKNELSRLVASNLLFFLDMSKLTFLKWARHNFNGELSSNFDAHAITDVFTAYENKFKALTRSISFERIALKGFELHARNTKHHKKGDLKRAVNKRERTPLSICLTYLARYGNDGIVDYVKSHIGEDEKKTSFYENILRCIEKYSFDRLMRLAVQRRERSLGRYAHPIVFKSPTFRGRSRKKAIVAWNKNYGSRINAFVSLSWGARKSMDIPIKYAKGWHGRMSEWRKKNQDYEYTLAFDEQSHEVRVLLCKEGERHIPTVDETDEVVGIDVNVKHNLLTLSDGTVYDYDRELVADYASCCGRVDELKSMSNDYVVGKRRQRKLDALKRKMVKEEENMAADMCKSLSERGVRHIAMENLDNGFGKSYVRDKANEGLNFNRIVSFLGISSVKGIVEHVARKYGVAVSTVHSSYTSKMCPICGCIDDGNRETQEGFKCVECGHECNADVNAAVNIRDRVREAVLRSALLKQLVNGAYKPKPLSRDRVKETLLTLRRNHRIRGGSERDESPMRTVGHV